MGKEQKYAYIPGAGGGTDANAIHDNESAEISAIAEKAALVGADLFIIEDSENANVKKRVQFTNVTSGGAHAATHQNGGADEINVGGLSGELADDQPPKDHAADHQSGGSDAIQLDDLSAPDDNTDLNASTTKHGLMPKGSGTANHYFKSDNSQGALHAATEAVPGALEIATQAEINTGTDTGRAITPDALAGSNFGIRYLQAVLFEFATDCETGDGKMYFHTPPALDGMNLVYCHAEVITAGTTGTMDIQIHNVDNALDMLSTKLTIDSGETGSDTAATAYVINASNDHVNTNDVIRIDIDAIHTTAAKGLIVTMGFQLP